MTRMLHGDVFAAGLALDQAVRQGVEQATSQLQKSMVAPATERRTDFCGSQRIRDILRTRARRGMLFGYNLFADPAWDILLELYASWFEQRRVSVTSLSMASGVPATTALRWTNILLQEGLIRREDDPLDRRRAFVELSEKGLSLLDAYFGDIPIHCRVI